jgi:hypothetical protein
MPVLVGGVGELYQGDLDFGRLAAEQLAGADLGPDVLVEELHYGALAVAQRIAELRPAALVLIGACPGSQAPGRLRRRRIHGHRPSTADFQQSLGGAATGYVGIDLVIDVAAGLGVLPDRTVTVELEPVTTGPAARLSPLAARALPQAVGLARAEALRTPLLELAGRLADQHPDRLGRRGAAGTVVLLLEELRALDRTGRWGRSFSLRDRLRIQIATELPADGMDHLDWGLWWALIEELDRLEALEAASGTPEAGEPPGRAGYPDEGTDAATRAGPV